VYPPFGFSQSLIGEPIHQRTNQGRGIKVTAYLSPWIVNWTNHNNPTAIDGIMEPLNNMNFTFNHRGQKHGQWVAGHLVAARFGGPNEAWNLVPLTQLANNKMYGTYEQQVWNLCNDVKQHTEMYHRGLRRPNTVYVIRYSVEAVGELRVRDQIHGSVDVALIDRNRAAWNAIPHSLWLEVRILEGTWPSQDPVTQWGEADLADFGGIQSRIENRLKGFPAGDVENKVQHLTWPPPASAASSSSVGAISQTGPSAPPPMAARFHPMETRAQAEKRNAPGPGPSNSQPPDLKRYKPKS
jgi:hypothetical protein